MQKKNKFILQQSIIIFCLTILFTIIVFLIKNYYFSAVISSNEIEENYIEPTINIHNTLENPQYIEIKSQENIENIWSGKLDIDTITLTWSKLSQLIEENYTSAAAFSFQYIPDSFEKKSIDFSKIFWEFLQSKIMKSMIHNLDIHLHEDLIDVRGKMKKRSVNLYWYAQNKKAEYFSVAVHELAHFLDIYFLEKKVYQDFSDAFYEISWKNTKVIIPWQTQSDFVSGYAMTNKYEDFAESFTYYILHNDDFLRKTLSSKQLSEKYDFFSDFLLKNKFTHTDFSIDNTVQDYYRDITKIDIDIEKLLQYLKNWI
mgnify:CR=1 FL=1